MQYSDSYQSKNRRISNIILKPKQDAEHVLDTTQVRQFPEWV
jgi:hypothetical protein